MASLYDDEHRFSDDVEAENEEEIKQEQIHQLDETSQQSTNSRYKPVNREPAISEVSVDEDVESEEEPTQTKYQVYLPE